MSRIVLVLSLAACGHGALCDVSQDQVVDCVVSEVNAQLGCQQLSSSGNEVTNLVTGVVSTVRFVATIDTTATFVFDTGLTVWDTSGKSNLIQIDQGGKSVQEMAVLLTHELGHAMSLRYANPGDPQHSTEQSEIMFHSAPRWLTAANLAVYASQLQDQKLACQGFFE